MKPVVKDQRTLQQNQRFHAMLGELAKYTGIRAIILKLLVKRVIGFDMGLFDQEVYELSDGHVVIPLSTTKYNVQEMTDLMMEIEAWAATDLDYIFESQRRDYE